MWTALISPLASLARTYLNGRVDKAKAETEAKVATTEAKATIMKKVAAGEIDWNQTWAEGAQSSWKDEWLSIETVSKGRYRLSTSLGEGSCDGTTRQENRL